jgi:hypothetical protein
VIFCSDPFKWKTLEALCSSVESYKESLTKQEDLEIKIDDSFANKIADFVSIKSKY